MTERPADWDARVERVRGLFGESKRRDVDLSEVNFTLADELAALAPLGAELARNLAVEAGVTPGPLEIIEKTAPAWPIEERRAGVAWKAYQLLARSPDRFELLAKMLADPTFPTGWREGRRMGADDNPVTADRVRILLGLQQDRKATDGAEGKARQLIRDLADRDVRAAILGIKDKSKAARAAREMADAYEKAELAADRKAIREADAAEKRLRSRAGHPPPHPITAWEDMLKVMDGAIVRLTLMGREADFIPGHFRATVFRKAGQAEQKAGDLRRALPDVDPDVVEGTAGPVVIPMPALPPGRTEGADNTEDDAADAEIVD